MADTQGQVVLSTEAVLYQNAAATAQAFSELRATAAACPPTSVPSPVGEPAVTTTFNPRPDASWPQTPTVERLAYDFVATDGQGVTQDSIAVYLRRGSVLMGLYFPTPGAPPAIYGQSSIAATVGLFAARMAKLPASVVDGTRPSAGPSTPTGPTTPGTQSLPGPSVN